MTSVVIGALRVKLRFVIKIFILSIFEWPFFTGFPVYSNQSVQLLYLAQDYTSLRLHKMARLHGISEILILN